MIISVSVSSSVLALNEPRASYVYKVLIEINHSLKNGDFPI